VIGIFLGKEPIKIISEKTGAHKSGAQPDMTPIMEREIEELARNSRASVLERI